jgi:hypothetical protein
MVISVHASPFTARWMRGKAAYATRNADAEFDETVREAMAQGAEAGIAEAVELGKAASISGDPDLMRIAEAFHRCAVSYAEKTAPRQYGQLVKLANPEGGPIEIQVVNYALPAVEKKALQAINAPATPAIEAQFDEIDPV